MRHARIHFWATALFALGYVLAGSGWSFVFTRAIDGRPSWSVCGQEMCSCVKPVDDLPACPLCEAGLMDPSERDADCSQKSGVPVKRVPKRNATIDAVGGAGSSAAVALYVGMMIGRVDASGTAVVDRGVVALSNDRVPRSLGLDLPVPPPRG